MSDRSERIIGLAQELLGRAITVPTLPQTARKKGESVELKADYIAALLATTSNGMTSRLSREILRPMSRYERIELEALFFYTARETGLEEETIREETQSFLALASLQELSAIDYLKIREYLWDRLDKFKAKKSST